MQNQPMKTPRRSSWGLKLAIYFMIAACGFVLGGFTFWGYQFLTYNDHINNQIAVKWGDGKYGKAFYGAEVYVQENGTGKLWVKARVSIGRGSGLLQYIHNCGLIGLVDTHEEAVEKYSDIVWSDQGLTIGTGKSAYFLARADLENHR